jgi:hypothetical protein
MSKSAITKLFVGSVIAVFAGVLLAILAAVAAFAGGAFQIDGADVVRFNGSAFTWTMIGLMVVAFFAMVGGAIGGLVAWIGALLNTVKIEDKSWFLALLVLGLLSFGFVAMIAYVIAGPDGTTQPVATREATLHTGGAPA